jgi:hypothetical protein
MSSRKLVSDAARALAAKRKTFSGGDRTVLAPCRHCGKPFGARARREHEPRCSKNPRRRANPAGKD